MPGYPAIPLADAATAAVDVVSARVHGRKPYSSPRCSPARAIDTRYPGAVPSAVASRRSPWGGSQSTVFCAFVREWVFGPHYASWTGRQGRKTAMCQRYKVMPTKVGGRGRAVPVGCLSYPRSRPHGCGDVGATAAWCARYTYSGEG